MKIACGSAELENCYDLWLGWNKIETDSQVLLPGTYMFT